MKKFVYCLVYILFIQIGVILMRLAYNEWNSFGDYNFISFIISFAIHLCPMIIIAYVIVRGMKRW